MEYRPGRGRPALGSLSWSALPAPVAPSETLTTEAPSPAMIPYRASCPTASSRTAPVASRVKRGARKAGRFSAIAATQLAAIERTYMGTSWSSVSPESGRRLEKGGSEREHAIVRAHGRFTRFSTGVQTPPFTASCDRGMGAGYWPNNKYSKGLLLKRIQTLGGLAVFDGPLPLGGNAQQPRRLAILAVLARSGDRGVNRDRLATLLWGEVEEERGRRNLNQALYALRHELGSEDAILGTRELRLNPELIEVDLHGFETARASGAIEEAARLYGGPFLGDFHLPGVPGFAHWGEEERAGLEADYRSVLEAAAAAATARDDRAAAVLWWRRLAALDPTDQRGAQGLMRALAAAGDVPGALRHAEIFHQLRLTELELPPDPAVEALAERIRRGEEAPTPAVKLPPQSQTTGSGPSTVPPPAGAPVSESLPTPDSRPLTTSSTLPTP